MLPLTCLYKWAVLYYLSAYIGVKQHHMVESLCTRHGIMAAVGARQGTV